MFSVLNVRFFASVQVFYSVHCSAPDPARRTRNRAHAPCSVRMSESERNDPVDGHGRCETPMDGAVVFGSPSVDGGVALEESLPVGGLSIGVPSMATSTLSDLVPTSERPHDGVGGQDPTWCPGSPAGAKACPPDPGPCGYEFVSSAPADSRGGVCGSAHSHSL